MRAIRALVMLTLLPAVVGCESREVGEQSPATPTSKKGEPVFSDDFERSELGDAWHRGSGEDGKGEWKIEDGQVLGSALKNDPLWLTKPLPKHARVEFDATAASPTGDLKVELFGDGENHASGYIVIFGGWKNSLDVIARLDEHGEDRKSKQTSGVAQNHTYTMAIERGRDGTLRWFVDGELHMSYDDPDPLMGEGHRHFAFSNWLAPVRFDNVKVYELQ